MFKSRPNKSLHTPIPNPPFSVSYVVSPESFSGSSPGTKEEQLFFSAPAAPEPGALYTDVTTGETYTWQRARHENGTFVKDDTITDENEAWGWTLVQDNELS